MASDPRSTQPAPVTRGFLFADLRGYSAFTEEHGDSAARRLLDAYRRIVRRVVADFGGAEIKTEGDSFYVVFPSATSAVKCALAIVEAASEATREQPQLPINVGIGIHAGETADSEEGYVGSAINVAARLCDAAGAGEVLVSETVRGLTRTGGEIRYVSRGTKKFKGISEAIPVFTASSQTGPTTVRLQRSAVGGSRGLIATAIAAATLLLVAVLVWATGGLVAPPTQSPPASPTLNAQASSSSIAPSGQTATPSSSGGIPEMPYIEPVPAAGRYALSKFFLSPDFDTDGDWKLGACVYSAPTGRCPYGNGYDPDLAELHRADRPQSMLALFHPTRLLTDPCGNDPAPTIGPDDSFLHWIRSQPALHVSDPIQRGFAHVDATQWYVTVGATESAGPTDAGTPCPLNDPASVAIKPYEMTPLALSAGQSIRMYSLTKPSDVFVFLITPNQEEFALVETPAEDLLNTLHFP